MALKLFRRKSKEPKAEVKAEKKVKVDKKVVEVRSHPYPVLDRQPSMRRWCSILPK